MSELANYLVTKGGTPDLVTDWNVAKNERGTTVFIAPEVAPGSRRVFFSKPQVARFIRASNPTSGLREIPLYGK